MSITILLTLKGRPLHTLRWMWHANRTCFPFKLVIADGGDDRIVTDTLASPELFPNLMYQYFKYDDVDLSAYWFKLADAVSKITTPYVMLMDNDDFVLPHGVSSARAFLDSHSDYICAGSPAISFSIMSEPGEYSDISGFIYTASLDPLPPDYDEDTAMSRLRSYMSNRASLFYHLWRRNVLLSIFSENMRRNFNNYDIFEHHIYLTALMHGKAKHLPSIGYMRQLGTSQSHASNRGFAYNIIYRGWGLDYEKVISSLLSTAVVKGLPTVEAEMLLKEYFHRGLLTVRIIRPPPPKRGRLRQTLIALRQVQVLSWRRRWQGIMNSLRGMGADSGDLRHLASEVDAVRDSTRNPAFIAFAKECRQRMAKD